MALYLGTSGWSYRDWQKIFYPRGVSGAKRLPFYAQRYNTVEINVTFYRFPTDTMLASWNASVPDDFCSAVKGSRRITHAKNLPDQSTVDYFFARVAHLRTLRMLLWQFPPHRRRDDAYLERFLQCVAGAPSGVRQAVEFRHESWWNRKTADALKAAGTAFVQVSHPTLPDKAPRTADFTYLRMHGLDAANKYHYDYSDDELYVWAKRLRRALAEGDAYAYFNNDVEGHALRNADRLSMHLSVRAKPSIDENIPKLLHRN